MDGAYFVRKGTNPDLDSFSAFFDNIKSSDGSTGLDQHLLDVRNISTVFICGLATDYCVGSSALDSLSLGLNTFVILDASRGIADESIENMLNAIVDKGGIILNTADVEPLMMRARAAAAAAAVLASAATAGSSSTGGNVISSSAFFFLILQRLLLLLLLRPTS